MYFLSMFFLSYTTSVMPLDLIPLIEGRFTRFFDKLSFIFLYKLIEGFRALYCIFKPVFVKIYPNFIFLNLWDSISPYFKGFINFPWLVGPAERAFPPFGIFYFPFKRTVCENELCFTISILLFLWPYGLFDRHFTKNLVLYRVDSRQSTVFSVHYVSCFENLLFVVCSSRSNFEWF